MKLILRTFIESTNEENGDVDVMGSGNIEYKNLRATSEDVCEMDAILCEARKNIDKIVKRIRKNITHNPVQSHTD